MKSNYFIFLHKLNEHSKAKIYVLKHTRKKFIEKTLNVFIRNGLIETYSRYFRANLLQIRLKYLFRTMQVLQRLILLSGSRFIQTARLDLLNLLRIDFPYGSLLLNTDQGLLTDLEALNKNVGGQLICWYF